MDHASSDDIQLVPIDKMVAWPDNPNKMSDLDFQMLKYGIETTGFHQNILVWARPDGTFEMIDGHHRMEAAAEAGYVELPAKVLPEDYPLEQVEALRLALNRLRGTQSTTKVAEILSRLSEEYPQMDMALTGYGEEEYQDLISSLQEDKLDDILDEVGGMTVQDSDDSSKVFTLELTYQTAEELKAVKKALKRAADGGDLAYGLQCLLGLN